MKLIDVVFFSGIFLPKMRCITYGFWISFKETTKQSCI